MIVRKRRVQGVHLPVLLAALILAAPAADAASTQTVTLVGTPHLTGLDVAPTQEQLADTIEALAGFEPTQVCVERMGGALIESQISDSGLHGMTLQPGTHGRHLADRIIPAGMQMQAMLQVRGRDAREEAARLVARWDELASNERIRAVGLQIAGFEFHGAALNWTYFDADERELAGKSLPSAILAALEAAASSIHEVYSLAIPLARRFGLHELCTADVLEDETRGMQVALERGGQAVLDRPEVAEVLSEYVERMAAAWRPGDGPGALTALLRFVNSEEFATMDRDLQWETLREFDNPEGAFNSRLMYWHARTAEISAELYRALAKGPGQRVLLIIGAAHRPFSEADLRTQPWVEVVPASSLLAAGRVESGE